MKGIFTLVLAACAVPAALAATQLPGSLAGQWVPPAAQTAAGAGQGDSLTVQQAVARVIANHPAVREASQGVAVSRARVEERQTAFSPVVAAEGLYSRIGPVEKLDFQGESFALYPANNYNANVSLRHTLYDWGRRQAAVDQARTMEKGATENVELVKSRLAYRTIGAFYAIIFLRDNIAVQDEEIAALQKHLDITQEKVRSGTATNFEVLTTQVRIATAKSQRVDLVDALEEQTIALRQLMGAPDDEPLNPAGDFMADTSAVNADSLVALALSQRPELTLARNAVTTAQAQTHLASLGDRPALNLDVTVGGKNGYIPNLNEIKPNFVAAMAFQFPIFDGHLTRTRVSESEAAVQAAQARVLSLQRQVTTEVRQATAAVQASMDKIRASQLQVQQAQAALELARTRYQAGVITNLDILDAETSLSGARLMELRARYALVQSRYRLRQAVGQKVW
ncbi:MAG: TolC family protein [Gemmatimonadota bacterium]|jgi:outer membrane protein